MNWSSIGEKTPTLQWQLFDSPVIETELFRIRNYWTINPYYGMKAYLGQFFGTIDEVVLPIRIYPIKDTSHLIEIKIPQEFKNDGITIRYIGIKLATPYRLGINRYDWKVFIDEYIS